MQVNQQRLLEAIESEAPHTTPVPDIQFAAVEPSTTGAHVEAITTNAVLATQEVMKVAQDLQDLVVQNAARVKVELDEHSALAAAVKNEAEQLGEVIRKLRDAQAEVARQRKAGTQH